jgi:glycosyltransferase involved in cell wall biosynthesis
MRILYIIASLGVGGKERRLVELLKGMRTKSNVECALVIMSKDIHYNEIQDLKIPIYYFPRNIFTHLQFFLSFYKICKEFKPTIVHSWDSMASLYFGLIARLLKIKFVNASIASAQSNMSWRKRKYIAMNLAYPFSNMVVSNSNAGLKAFKVPLKKGVSIYNGFDLNRLNNLVSPNEIRNKFGVTKKFVIGMVASFTKLKDYESFIKAAQIILDEHTEIAFIAVGDGPDQVRIENLIDPKYREEIIFIGKQQQIESIVNLFNIGILSTNDKIHGEGISNSIMEYMALAKPVIASKGGGTSELVIDGETGYLIEPRNPELLAEKIIFLLNNPDIADEMGKKGKERIIKHFSIEKMVTETYKLYVKVLSKNP